MQEMLGGRIKLEGLLQELVHRHTSILLWRDHKVLFEKFISIIQPPHEDHGKDTWVNHHPPSPQSCMKTPDLRDKVT